MNELKAALIASFREFLSDLAPEVDEAMVLEKVGSPIMNLFTKQRTGDLAHKALGREFNQALRLYFSQFLVGEKVDFKRLRTSFEPHERNFLLHLGRERLAYLKLLLKMSECVEDKRPGLLFSEVS